MNKVRLLGGYDVNKPANWYKFEIRERKHWDNSNKYLKPRSILLGSTLTIEFVEYQAKYGHDKTGPAKRVNYLYSVKLDEFGRLLDGSDSSAVLVEFAANYIAEGLGCDVIDVLEWFELEGWTKLVNGVYYPAEDGAPRLGSLVYSNGLNHGSELRGELFNIDFNELKGYSVDEFALWLKMTA